MAIKALLSRLTPTDEFTRRWPKQSHHKSQVFERIMSSSIEYVAKQVLPFKQIPYLVTINT